MALKSPPHHGARAAREQALAAFFDVGRKLLESGDGAGGEPFDEPDASALYRSIESEIIPRLMLTHATPPAASAGDATAPDPLVTSRDRLRLMESVLAASPTPSRRLLDELRDRDVPREAILLDLLAFAARRLGELWEADLCDFTHVTIGLCRLHGLLRDLSFPPEGHTALSSDAPRILLATASSDQHVFGVVMVSEFFRKAGWNVVTEAGAPTERLMALVRERSFDLLGLSAACSTLVRDARDQIARVRSASCNSGLKVLVGGRLFADEPDLVREVGADAAALDAQTAPDAGKSLLGRTPDGD